MPPPEGEDLPRKGRGNAILTYETVAALDAKLTRVDAKLDYLHDRMLHREAEHKDHEVRIRVLEQFHASHAASSTSSSDIWKWSWAALVSVAMIALGILNYLK